MNSSVKDKRQVWVWTEHYQKGLASVSLGLLGKAHELCQQLGGGEVASVLVGTDSPQLVTELLDYGTDKVYLADDPISCVVRGTGIVLEDLKSLEEILLPTEYKKR